MKYISLVALFLVISINVDAGGSEGTISTPLAHTGNIFMFSAGTHQSAPTCSTATVGTWVVSLDQEYGKSVQSLVMMAYAQGKRLHVQGNNLCDVWADRETVSYVYIVN